MEIRPIHTDADHETALREIERLWGAANGTPGADRLEILVTLVEKYEDRRWPVEEVDPVEAIEAAMAHEGLTRADLGRLIGPSRATEVLQRKRSLTLPMIRKIASNWHVPERVLVQEYPLRSNAKRGDAPIPNARTRAAMAEARGMLRPRRSGAHSSR